MINQEHLKIDRQFIPCIADNNDELFANGIFEFNVSRMIKYIKENPDKFTQKTVAVDDSFICFSAIDESHLGSVDIGEPVILVEISPGQYNLIDGNHRMEKARRSGIKRLFAYKLNPAQHINFMTTQKSYEAYIEYWNTKLDQ
jgi:hypothetical protein